MLHHDPVSYTHLRAHETLRYLVCRLLLEKKKDKNIIGPNIPGRDEAKNGIAPEIEEYFMYTPKPAYPTNNLGGGGGAKGTRIANCLLYTSPSPRDATLSRMPSSA